MNRYTLTEELRHAELCEFCDELIVDDECDCTGTVVGDDVVLLPEWAPGEQGAA